MDNETALIPGVNFDQSIKDVSGQIGKRSGRIYASDAKKFARCGGSRNKASPSRA